MSTPETTVNYHMAYNECPNLISAERGGRTHYFTSKRCFTSALSFINFFIANVRLNVTANENPLGTSIQLLDNNNLSGKLPLECSSLKYLDKLDLSEPSEPKSIAFVLHCQNVPEESV
ncbi:unnamed protein product [Amaranthus hypochondriacus]